MNNTEKILSSDFIDTLHQEGYFVDDLLMEIEEKTAVAALGLNSVQPGLNEMVGRQTAKKIIRLWTGLSNDGINAGLYNPERDEQLPLIQQAVASLSSAWLEKNLVPPDLTVKQITRRTGLAPERIVRLVNSFQPEIKNGSGNYVLNIVDSEPLKPLIENGYSSPLNNIRGLGLSPKRILKSARYQSRPPGGGPVQRARLQDKNIPGIIRRMALENAGITFQPFPKSPAGSPRGQPRVWAGEAGRLTLEGFMSPDVKKVIDWFKKQRRKKWVLGENEKLLKDDLSSLANGEPVDFICWNCLEFKWRQDPQNNYPACVLESGVDNSIVLFQLPRLQEMAKTLSALGKPEFIVLAPTNEAFYPEMWTYSQSEEERSQVVESAVSGLNSTFKKSVDTDKINIKAMRWDEYLKSRGVSEDPKEYSLRGERKVRQSSNFPTIEKEAVKNGVEYFEQNGITVNPDKIAVKRIRYYGVYAGEGIALSEIRATKRKVIVVNFEEFRVPKMALLGADGKLPIVTPISDQEMNEYYRQSNNR